jgi:hypothetical protein
LHGILKETILDNRAALYKRVASLSKMHKEVGVSRNHDPLRASIGQALKFMMMMTVVMMMILHDGRDGDDGVDNNYDDDAGRLSLSIVRVPTCHCL